MAPATRSQTAVQFAGSESSREEPSRDVGSRLSNDAGSTRSQRSNRSNAPDEPPRFRINLSIPPEERYLEVCAAFKTEMRHLTSLFDEVVGGGMVNFLPITWLRLLCWIFLRRVYDDEENAELKGISTATGVHMYLLVCFNVLLDLFMGCSSGGALVRAGEGGNETKMVHFRTLDWGMDGLRRVVVQLDYVVEKDGPVIASSITYAGFVGVLTGVRKDLSLSLNFRPHRNDNGKLADIKYVWHLLLVLLGRRPSISTNLRQFLLPRPKRRKRMAGISCQKDCELAAMSYADVIKTMVGQIGKSQPITTTPCYLCCSNGKETTVLEKDLTSAKVRASTDFVVVTNGDEEPDENRTEEKKEGPILNASMGEIFDEAEDRQLCAIENWTSMRSAKLQRLELDANFDHQYPPSLMEVDDVVEMVQKYPTTNECTHFAAVMDPGAGDVKWCRIWMQPVSDRWIREHG